jgi:TonB family protein
MNRLQKKCVIATVGFHLLLLAILIIGPAFVNPNSKPDETRVLDVIPANLIDAAMNSGVRNAAPPPPAPVVAPQPQVPPPQPQPTVPPPPPKPVEPTPSLTERVKKLFKPEPKPETKPERVEPSPKPTPRPATEPHKIQPNLTPVVRTSPANHTSRVKPDNSRTAAQALNNAIKTLKNNLAPAMTVDMPGDSSVAYANYASVVKSVYEQAWIPPNDTTSDDANTKVKVTIARDGTVISARIIEPSGNAATDDSVQRTLDRVKSIAPFPDDSTDKERTYTINFNLKAKRMLE